MLTLALGLALAAECPREPALRDPDGEVTVLAQNLKFIITGEKRRERNELLAEWLRDEGAGIDLLMLSEARLTGGFDAWAPEWCFYTQAASEPDAYEWAPITSGRPPAGLALGVRQREEGEERHVGTFAGRRYRAAPTSLAEGFLGKLFNFEKGWAGIEIDDTHLVWSHTQASYRKNPETGAGGAGRGRAGQFEDLAEDLGRPDRPTLLTGDLNLLAGFKPRDAADEPRVALARATDDETVARFRERTGIDLAWPWARRKDEPARAQADQALASDDTQLVSVASFQVDDSATTAGATAPAAEGPVGTFAGDIDRRRAERVWDTGAPYDRVGVNDAFLAQHPGTRVRRVEIRRGWMGVSDHMGLEIAIPFARPTAPRALQLAQAPAPPRACLGAARPLAQRSLHARSGHGQSSLRVSFDAPVRANGGAIRAPAWLQAPLFDPVTARPRPARAETEEPARPVEQAAAASTPVEPLVREPIQGDAGSAGHPHPGLAE